MVDLVPYWQPVLVDEAAQRETYVAAERLSGLATALGHMGVGTPGRAYAAVMRTYLRQVRILGLAYAGIPGRSYEIGVPIYGAGVVALKQSDGEDATSFFAIDGHTASPVLYPVDERHEATS